MSAMDFLRDPPSHVAHATVTDALSILCEEIESIVPIVRAESIPLGTSGAFMYHPNERWRDHIMVGDRNPPHLELIILAHEYGHVLNSYYEPTRFREAIIQNFMWRNLGIEPTMPELIVGEEFAANRRGRRYVKSIIPELLAEYDFVMELCLEIYRTRGWIRPETPRFNWLVAA